MRGNCADIGNWQFCMILCDFRQLCGKTFLIDPRLKRWKFLIFFGPEAFYMLGGHIGLVLHRRWCLSELTCRAIWICLFQDFLLLKLFKHLAHFNLFFSDLVSWCLLSLSSFVKVVPPLMSAFSLNRISGDELTNSSLISNDWDSWIVIVVVETGLVLQLNCLAQDWDLLVT